MKAEKAIKLSDKQKEVVKLMQNGWVLLIGTSEVTGRQFYEVTKGFDKVYFNSTVFGNLITKGLVEQEQHHPFHYELTELGATIQID